MQDNDIRIKRARKVLQQAQARRESLKAKAEEFDPEGFWKMRLNEEEATIKTLKGLLVDMREIP